MKKGFEYTLSEVRDIIQKIRRCVLNWESTPSGPFSWVDDCLNAYMGNADLCHYIHIGWVSEWNRTERALPMSIFLREWITEINIVFALEHTHYWQEGQGEI